MGLASWANCQDYAMRPLFSSDWAIEPGPNKYRAAVYTKAGTGYYVLIRAINLNHAEAWAMRFCDSMGLELRILEEM